MPIQTACNFCRKLYTLDDAVLGKKVRCKECGNIFVVTEGGAGGEQVAAPRSRGEQRFDDQEGPAYDFAAVKPAGSGQIADFGGQVETACPSCGVGLALLSKVCTNCGYNRRTGGRQKTSVELVDKRERGSHYEYRFDGVRKNLPFENPVADFLERWGSGSGYILWKASLFVAIGLTLVVGFLSGLAAIFIIPLFLVVIFLYWGTFYYVIARGMDWGVDRAGSILKFETPTDSHERMIAVVVWSEILATPFQLLVRAAAELVVVNRTTGMPNIEPLITAILLYYAVLAMLSYLVLTCFYRLRWVEAIVAWFFMSLYGLLAMIIVFVVAYGAIWALATIVKNHPFH